MRSSFYHSVRAVPHSRSDRRRAFTAAATVACSALVTGWGLPAHAANWKNAVSGDWHTNGFWSTNAYPTSTTDANFLVGGTYTVNITFANANARYVNIGPANVTFNATRTLTLSGELDVECPLIGFLLIMRLLAATP